MVGQNILFSILLVMSELGSSEKNNMKYWLCDQYYKTTDRYEVHINKTLLELVLYLFSRKEEMNVDKVQFWFKSKIAVHSYPLG